MGPKIVLVFVSFDKPEVTEGSEIMSFLIKIDQKRVWVQEMPGNMTLGLFNDNIKFQVKPEVITSWLRN